jgi:hypothetical protein
MYLIDRFWICITYVLSYLTPSPFKGIGGLEQAPFLASSGSGPLHHYNGPIFRPPGGRLGGPGSEFTCEYPQMVGWSFCSTPENRACWLRNDKTGAEYNITTDYEDINQTPIGITRNYVIDLTDEEINADGLAFPEGKIYNKTYPGPWIQACWGDVCLYFSNLSFFLNFLETRHNILTRLADCHDHCQEPPRLQWHHCSLAWDSTMAEYANGRCQWRYSMSNRSWGKFRLYLESHAIWEFVVP